MTDKNQDKNKPNCWADSASGYSLIGGVLSPGFYNMDCMVAMAGFPDNYFDLAIVDPPYRGAKDNAPTKHMRAKQGNMKRWGEKPNQEYFDELNRISNSQIIWGGNNFNLPPTNGIIFWYKRNSCCNYSDGELAWTSFNCVARCFDYAWGGLSDGVVGRNKKQKTIHPTQKPVQLYKWLLLNYAEAGNKILDTHVGSGSSLIACEHEGFEYHGFEIDTDYYNAAVKRIKRETSQIGMF